MEEEEELFKNLDNIKKEDLKETTKKLHMIKNDLLKLAQNSGTDQDEFNMKIMDLVSKEQEFKDIYQIILLSASNMRTDHKAFKNTIVAIFNDYISIKLMMVSNLEKILYSVEDKDERIRQLEKAIVDMEDKYSHMKTDAIGINIPKVGLFKLKDLIVYFVIVYALYLNNPEAAEKAIDAITMFIPIGG